MECHILIFFVQICFPKDFHVCFCFFDILLCVSLESLSVCICMKYACVYVFVCTNERHKSPLAVFYSFAVYFF